MAAGCLLGVSIRVLISDKLPALACKLAIPALPTPGDSANLMLRLESGLARIGEAAQRPASSISFRRDLLKVGRDEVRRRAQVPEALARVSYRAGRSARGSRSRLSLRSYGNGITTYVD